MGSPALNVPVARVMRLLELSAAKAGVDDFGLRLAETREVSNLGLLPVVAREAPTMRVGWLLWRATRGCTARRCRCGWKRWTSPGWSVPFSPDIDRDPVRQTVELVMGVLHRMLQELYAEDWDPDLVCFAHPPPRDRARHRRVFGGFRAVRRSGHRVRVPTSEDGAAASCPGVVLGLDARAGLEDSLARHQTGAAAKVRQTIAWLLPTGLCSAEAVARRLGLQRRTMHRHLAKEGESYARLLDEVRRGLAREMLSQPRSLKQVVAALGFESSSTLSRWCRAQLGCTATEMRSRPHDGTA